MRFSSAILSLAVICLLLSSVWFFYEANELRGQVNTLNLENSRLKIKISDLKSEYDTLRQSFYKLKLEYNKLKESCQTNNSNLNLSALNEEISKLKEENARLRKQCSVQVLNVCFSPHGECDEVLDHWITRANKSVYVLIYSFTLKNVAEDLVQAYKRGVDVRVVIEKENLKGSVFDLLKNAGVPVLPDANSALMHDKVTIIDGYIVITGSYNYSWSATHRNNENLLVLRSPYLANLYTEQFSEIWHKAGGS